jgi:hypothetical protein
VRFLVLSVRGRSGCNAHVVVRLRGGGNPVKNATRRVVYSVSALSIVACAALALLAPGPSEASYGAIAAFAIFVLLGGALPYRLSSNHTGGSVAFVAIIAGVSIAPSWLSALVFASAQALLEVVQRRTNLKGVFNSAQHLLSISLAAGAYITVAHLVGALDVGQIAPLAAAYFAFSLTNSGAVAWVISVDSGVGFREVWLGNSRRSFVADIVTIPIAWTLAEVYARYGFLVASAAAASLFVVRQLNSANEDLARTNTELLELIVTTLEARDPFTSGHSRRVSRYARLIGQQLGIGSRELERLSAAALLHDVGKIHEAFVPVLSKPGRLTPEERALMETHPIKGADLVGMSSHLKDLVEPIRHHHESWDGTGYPDAKIGAEIPLFARVIAVADTIDAMASDRPYRRGLSAAIIREEVTKMRGRQFDPQIVDRLVESGVLDSLLVVACNRSDSPHESAASAVLAAEDSRRLVAV